MLPDHDQQPHEGVGVLVDDHAEVDELIQSLFAALDAQETTASFERLDLLWARLAVHIRAEHLCLFPSILSALDKSPHCSLEDIPLPECVQEVLERLRADHDFFMVELARAVNVARQWFEAGNNPSADQFSEIKRRVQILGDRLARHNRLEEGQVYLWPKLLLSAHERLEISARMKREIDNLPPRFAAGRSRSARLHIT